MIHCLRSIFALVLISLLTVNSSAATYYVSNSAIGGYPVGSDISGDGSASAPWLSITKATASVALSGGDVVNINDGVYGANETNGVITMGRAFTGFNIFQAISPGKVIIGGSIGPGAVIAAQSPKPASFYKWRNITFTGSPTVSNVVWLQGGNSIPPNNIYFDHCAFNTAKSYAILLKTGATSPHHITFDGCTFRQTDFSGDGYVVRVQKGSASDPVLSNITFDGCDASMQGGWSTAAGFQSLDNVTITDNRLAGVNSYGFIAGQDSSGLYPVTNLSLTGNFITSTHGHSVLIGGGVSGGIVDNNRVVGGDSVGFVGIGLGLKNCDGVTVSNNLCVGVPGSLGSLHIKAATHCTIKDNVCCAVGVGATAFYAGYNATGAVKFGYLVVQSNHFVASRGAQSVRWGDASEDSGGSVLDRNLYDIRGTGRLGIIRGISVVTIADAQTAWMGYDIAGNDAHSLIGSLSALLP